MQKNLNSFKSLASLTSQKIALKYYSIPEFEKTTGKSLKHLPFSLKILLENLLRTEDGIAVKKSDIEKLAN